MARFHLPFATLEETLSRVVSTYLVFQYFKHKDGHDFDKELHGMDQIYNHFEKLLISMTERIKAGHFQGDAGINALIIIHSFTQLMSVFINQNLDILRPAFEPLLSAVNRDPSQV
ncbi:hypothetical protein CCP2SC5_500006 [Azospirillaceae bacterium]